MTDSTQPIRIDKWLWAARFFKTRALAKQAIETSRVLVNGQKTKPKRTLHKGDTVYVKQGFNEKTVIVLELSDVRRPYSEAKQLYRETDESIELGTKNAALRVQARQAIMDPGKKPTKNQRRVRISAKKNWE